MPVSHIEAQEYLSRPGNLAHWVNRWNEYHGTEGWTSELSDVGRVMAKQAARIAGLINY